MPRRKVLGIWNFGLRGQTAKTANNEHTLYEPTDNECADTAHRGGTVTNWMSESCWGCRQNLLQKEGGGGCLDFRIFLLSQLTLKTKAQQQRIAK